MSNDLFLRRHAERQRSIGRGSEEFAMQVKGVEFGMHEPRLKQGLGLIYSVSLNGADHCMGLHATLTLALSPRGERGFVLPSQILRFAYLPTRLRMTGSVRSG